MPAPDEFVDAAKFHAQDVGRMRAPREPRKPRDGKSGRTGWRAAAARLLKPFSRRSRQPPFPMLVTLDRKSVV